LNKIGKLLKAEPAMRRVMAMRKHIYVNGLKVRKMVENLGYFILKTVSQTGVPIDEICQAVERSNHLRKKQELLKEAEHESSQMRRNYH
jgi:hypothetical protein